MPPTVLCLIFTIETFPITIQWSNLAISLYECLLTSNMDKKARAYFSKATFVVAKSSVVMYSCLIFLKMIPYCNSNQIRKHTKLTLIWSVSIDIEEKLLES